VGGTADGDGVRYCSGSALRVSGSMEPVNPWAFIPTYLSPTELSLAVRGSFISKEAHLSQKGAAPVLLSIQRATSSLTPRAAN
jgi:hypothetical protein